VFLHEAGTIGTAPASSKAACGQRQLAAGIGLIPIDVLSKPGKVTMQMNGG
jgi:hypothetical protein